MKHGEEDLERSLGGQQPSAADTGSFVAFGRISQRNCLFAKVIAISGARVGRVLGRRVLGRRNFVVCVWVLFWATRQQTARRLFGWDEQCASGLNWILAMGDGNALRLGSHCKRVALSVFVDSLALS